MTITAWRDNFVGISQGLSLIPLGPKQGWVEERDSVRIPEAGNQWLTVQGARSRQEIGDRDRPARAVRHERFTLS